MRSTNIAVVAGTALAIAGCSSSDFNTPTKLNKVRILAIQAEPPQPALGATTTLRALVYQPPSVDGGAAEEIHYSWSWCPLATSSINGYACPIDQPAADQLFAGVPGVPPLDLGSGETASFTNPFPSAILASLCEGKTDAIPALAAAASAMGALTAGGGLNFSCTIAGFPITVMVVVHAPGADLPAVFRVYLPVNDNLAPNSNPVVDDIKVKVKDAYHLLDQAGTQGIPFNVAQPVAVDMALSNSEPVPDPNDVLPNPDDPNKAYVPSYGATSERLNLNWYAECGDFGGEGLGGDATGYIPGDQYSTFELATQNTWNIPKSEGCPAYLDRIIVVAIDGRGGVGWVGGVVHLGDTTSAPDAGEPDGQEADTGELVPDAGTLDSGELDEADTLPESTL
jgi:hypothetical protein